MNSLFFAKFIFVVRVQFIFNDISVNFVAWIQ
jgi:hypothetical protein